MMPDVGGWNHAEAFCLMQYETDDGTDGEVVWNSRDGVTPFVIRLPSGRVASHKRWQEDVCMGPDWRPSRWLRLRAFRDMSREAYVQAQRERIDSMWDDPEILMREDGRSKDEWLEVLARDWEPGMPELVDALEVLVDA